eukprot:g13124.t1
MQVSFRSLPSFELSPHLFPGGTNGSFFWVFSVVNTSWQPVFLVHIFFSCWHKSVAAKPSPHLFNLWVQVGTKLTAFMSALSTFFNFSLLFSTSSRLLALILSSSCSIFFCWLLLMHLINRYRDLTYFFDSFNTLFSILSQFYPLSSYYLSPSSSILNTSHLVIISVNTVQDSIVLSYSSLYLSSYYLSPSSWILNNLILSSFLSIPSKIRSVHHGKIFSLLVRSDQPGEVSRDGTSVDQDSTARRAPFQRAVSSTIFSDSHRVFSSSLFSPPVHVAAQHTSAENSSDNAAGPAQQIGQITSFSNFWAGLVSGSSIGRNDRERQRSKSGKSLSFSNFWAGPFSSSNGRNDREQQ